MGSGQIVARVGVVPADDSSGDEGWGLSQNVSCRARNVFG